jgi:membrane fusion protein (multidrug efflux system)
VSGRIGRSFVTEGAYVQQSQATLLATVQQLDPIYVDLTQSSVEHFRLKDDLANGRLKASGPDQARASLVMENGRDYAEAGTLQFSDVSVDPTTGSVVLRALFPNPNNDLLPGMFVRARLEEGVNPQALLLPQKGVSRNYKGEATALVVGADDKVEPRILTTGRVIGDAWLVTGGLAAGERVIVEGLQQLRPGIKVKPMPAQSKSSGSAATALNTTSKVATAGL